MAFEDQLTNAMFNSPSEKSFIDKLLGKGDVEEVRKIISKERLTRSDLMRLLNLLSSNEMKLLNYTDWDRYIMAKFFVWIREFVALAENLYDYENDLVNKKDMKLSKRTEQIFNNVFRLLEHNIKFLVDLYFNLGRTTLSVNAVGLLELLKNKYEVVYPESTMTQPQQQNPNHQGINFKWRRNN